VDGGENESIPGHKAAPSVLHWSTGHCWICKFVTKSKAYEYMSTMCAYVTGPKSLGTTATIKISVENRKVQQQGLDTGSG